MKKAFDDNVSRAKPRVKLGALLPTGAADGAGTVETVVATPPEVDLSAEVKARAERARPQQAVASEAASRPAFQAPADEVKGPSLNGAREGAPLKNGKSAIAAKVAASIKAQAERSAAATTQADSVARRDRLKERLRAVRENPRPEPLPATVAEAGVMAVERISTLQAELAQLKALNLALTQDLEGARRQAERATEETRSRMEEARRLTAEMETRAKLLLELERELAGLEEERDEALLSLQEARQALESARREQQALGEQIAKRDASMAESLAEEERLCAELENARSDAGALRKTLETLTSERDILARQVSELTTERMELLEARKALESVHQALTRMTTPSR